MKSSTISRVKEEAHQPEIVDHSPDVLTSEQALERVGPNGGFQKFLIAMLIPCFTLANFLVYGTSYLTKRPEFTCADGSSCSMERACSQGNYTTSYDNNLKNLTRALDLECISDTKMGLIGSCYFIGFMVGALFIPRSADLFGRRWVVVLGVAVHLIATLLFLFAVNIEMVYVCQVLLGLQSPSTMQVSFVLITEIVGQKYRPFYSTLILSINATLNLIIPGYYYFVKDYIYLVYFNIALSGVVFLALLFFLVESPRYFTSHRNFRRARDIYNLFARRNSRQPLHETQELLEGEKGQVDPQELDEAPRQALLPSDNEPKSEGLKALCKRRALACPLSIMAINWFLMGFVNYGIYFGVKYLEADIYLAGMVIGISQILGYPAGGFVIHMLGRKKNAIFGCICSVIFCALYLAASWLDWSTALILIFAGICNLGINIANSSLYLMTAELFPTVFRATVFGVVNIFGRTGSILSPLINEYLKKDSLFMVLFGGFMFLLGILMLPLPETKENQLPDTLADSIVKQSLKASLKP